VKSIMAKVLKWKWWHYRIAHVGYFDVETIKLCLKNAGFQIIEISRPTWYFPADYLIHRVMKYLPSFLEFPIPKFLSKVTIPLNLFDSIQVTFKKN